MTRIKLGWVLALVLVGAVLGCQGEGASAQPVARFRLEGAAAGKVEQLLSAYEVARARLAKDDVAGIGPDAEQMERAASEAASAAAKDGQPVLRSIAGAAKALREMPKQDADAVRKAFGEVSRHVVTLLVAVPALQQGRHVFFCPMAQEYGKWVQPKPQLENPYMGTRMLACGSASDWVP